MKLWNRAYRWYGRIAVRSRQLRILFIYYANLWKYNSQKAVESLLYGRPRQTKHVPFMITKNMRNSLSSLGYTEADIDKMTPGEASDAINHCIRKSTKAIQGSEIQKDKFTGVP